MWYQILIIAFNVLSCLLCINFNFPDLQKPGSFFTDGTRFKKRLWKRCYKNDVYQYDEVKIMVLKLHHKRTAFLDILLLGNLQGKAVSAHRILSEKICFF